MSDQYPYDPQAADPTRAYARPPQAGYHGGPATMSPQDERTWGAISHAGALVAMICSAGFLGFVASIVVYAIHKDRGPFVRAHAANSLNVQITMFIWIVVSIPLILLLGLGLLTLVAAPFVAGLLHVIGAIKAYNGEWWNPPLTPRFVK
ncbi:DUF4870 domain-containing protein [Nocardioides KLBMP 9356]|uniref:DUF4870 domain-containing protein n=1 Tax=Nocardioides potassii TaxID=2911371 RepID=A0ABS9HGF8_9ACTN|nr:DUF4870 domain-containing protein [Nocardioides potassii]MCF6379644.1 DUF4870 domain-containing protein [Nocardioides potassii]